MSNSINPEFKIREVAERIKAVRESLGLTPEEMAEKTDVSVYEYLAYEGGAKDFSFTFIYKFSNCRCTSYGGDSSSGCDIPLKLGKTGGMGNVPYGSKIYIPALKGKYIKDKNGKSVTCDGILTINDCGVCMSDCDIYMSTYSDSNAESIMGNPFRSDIYVLSWGSGHGTSWSFTSSYEWAYKRGVLSNYKTAFKNYISNGGVLINFYKFRSDDKNIKNTKYWKILNS